MVHPGHSSGASIPAFSALRPTSDVLVVAATIAKAVAQTAEAQGLARRPLTNPIADIYQRMWKPEYPRLEILPTNAES